MKKLINIKIDGIDVETRAGQTILCLLYTSDAADD